MTDPSKTVKVEATLRREEKAAVVQCLWDNGDVFAWSHEDMEGIDPAVMCRRLNIDPKVAPKQQRR